MQSSFFDKKYAAKKAVTRKKRFLGKSEAVTQCLALVQKIKQFYQKDGDQGQPSDWRGTHVAHVDCATMHWPLCQRHIKHVVQHLIHPPFCWYQPLSRITIGHGNLSSILPFARNTPIDPANLRNIPRPFCNQRSGAHGG